MVCLFDGKCVIYIAKLQSWWIGGRVDCLGFKLFYEQVGHNGADRGSHGCAIYLFIILTLEEEIGVLR